MRRLRLCTYWMLLCALVGCDDGTARDPDGGADGGAMDAGRDTGVPIDSGIDAGLDAGPAPDACVAESDTELCVAAGAECGETTTTDRCGVARTAVCGTCREGQSCSVRTANTCDYERWDVTTVDDRDDAGRQLSMVIDGDDAPWIAYRSDDSSRELRVAFLEGTTWTRETLDSGALVGVDTSIAISPAGDIVVAAPGPVRGGRASYAELWTRGGADSWTMRSTTPGSGTTLDLTFDAAGRAQLCVYDPPGAIGGFLVHVAEQADGTFTNATIDGSVASTSRHGRYCSIEVDPTGVLHTAYLDQQFLQLKYASLVPAESWASETVDAPAGDMAGNYAFMTLDSAGAPHVIYRALSIRGREIRHAVSSPTGWTIETLESDAGIIANYPSIAFDSAGAAHAVYFGSDTGGTFYYATDASGAWVREVLDVVGTGAGGYSAIALDSSDTVHIAFYDLEAGALRHAQRR